MDGEDIRAARERAKLTQLEFAERAGVSLRTVGNWERSDAPPKRAFRLAEKVLGAVVQRASSVAADVTPSRQVTLGDLSGLVERVEELERFRQDAERRLGALEGGAPVGAVSNPERPRLAQSPVAELRESGHALTAVCRVDTLAPGSDDTVLTPPSEGRGSDRATLTDRDSVSSTTTSYDDKTDEA